MRNAFLLFFITIVGYSSLFSGELNYTKKDVVDGWNMYSEQKQEVDKTFQTNIKIVNSKEKATLDDIFGVLSAIAIELRESRREINEMKRFINPNARHYITNEKGERCLANSSADCFEMPVIQEGRNIPALQDFIEKADIKTAKVWLGVQAKIFNRANNMGVALKFAGIEGGADVYPVYGKDMYTGMGAGTSKKEEDTIVRHLQKYKDSIGTILFLGETPELEKAWGKDSLARMIFPREKILNLLIVFKNKTTKYQYDRHFNALHDKELKSIYTHAKKIVNTDMFKKYQVSVTPSVVAVYKKDGKEIHNMIAKGFPSSIDIIYGYKQFLILNKLAHQKDFHADNIWKEKL